MQNPLNRVKGRLLERCRLHPTNADMIAFKDGELSRDRHALVSGHLQNCRRCQDAVRALEEDLSLFGNWTRMGDLEPLLEATWHGIQKAMETPGAEFPQNPQSQAEGQLSPSALASIREELTIYLGAQATERILGGPRSATSVSIPADLVGIIEPLMVGLLGNRGGAAVVGRVGALCGLPGTPGGPLVSQ